MGSKSIRITTLAEPGATRLKVVGRLHCDNFNELVRTTNKKDKIVRMGILIVVALLGAIHLSVGIAQEPGVAEATPEPDARIDPSEADIKLIRAGSEVFVAAFNKHDATAVADLWTEDGEYIADSGQRFAGREAIRKGYAQFFADHPDVAIRIAIDSVRLVSPNTAIEEGRAVIEPLPAGAAGIGEYTVVHAKIDGTWFMASVRDTRIEPPATVRSAADLEWLVGTWKAEEHGVQMESVCLWVVDGRFLARRYTTTQLDGTKTSGLQLIGWNPQGGHVQSWDFSSDGGHAVGVWAPMDGGWQAKVDGTTGGGAATSATNRLRRLDDNAYAWQSVRRSLGDVLLPDTDEIVIKRQPAP